MSCDWLSLQRPCYWWEVRWRAIGCLSLKSMTVSAPASPVQRKQRPVSMSSFSAHSPTYDSNTMPSDMPKKRRAPLPPDMMSQSMPADLSHHQGNPEPAGHLDGNQVSVKHFFINSWLVSSGNAVSFHTAKYLELSVIFIADPPSAFQSVSPLSSGPSTESCFRRTSTKRKAPPPPTLSAEAPPDETAQDGSVTGRLENVRRVLNRKNPRNVLTGFWVKNGL